LIGVLETAAFLFLSEKTLRLLMSKLPSAFRS